MRKILIILILILCIYLTGCVPTINKNIEYEIIDVDIDDDGKSDDFYMVVYYKKIKYVETMFIDEYCLSITEKDNILFKQSNFPMAGTTCIFTKDINEPDYLFAVNGDEVGNLSYGIYFRENITLEEEVFIYEDIEMKLLNEFIPVDDETNIFLRSLSYEEMEHLSIYVNGDILRMTMKNYPEISFFAYAIDYYDGKYYVFSRGRYYQLSDEFINFCEIINIKNATKIKPKI